MPIIRDPDKELLEALNELEDARTRIYYDADKDKTSRQSYYREFLEKQENKPLSFELLTTDQKKIRVTIEEQDLSLSGTGISFKALSQLVRKTHINSYRYKPSRYVYPWVDLHPDNKIHSIYSGNTFDAEEFIRADFSISQERAIRFRTMMTSDKEFSNEMLEDEFASLEASMPYNCEHVVPQSWFDKREPMRGDLHHLFACESRCNSFRSNIPYFDFVDYMEAVRDSCGKREGNKFEPESGKGTVARAVFYFLLRYPGEINSISREFEAERLPILLKWHKKYPVDDYERHCNMAVYEMQGNRNPLIDFPDWIEFVDFAKGLGEELLPGKMLNS